MTASLFDRLSGGRVFGCEHTQLENHVSVRQALLGSGESWRYDSSQKRILADLLAAFEFVPGTVVYAGYGGLYERRGWDDREWLPGQGDYRKTREASFSSSRIFTASERRRRWLTWRGPTEAMSCG